MKLVYLFESTPHDVDLHVPATRHDDCHVSCPCRVHVEKAKLRRRIGLLREWNLSDSNVFFELEAFRCQKSCCIPA
jgi:hypothetical protein